MYSVYVHTFPNGKKYVGITCWKPELRWGSNGCNYKNPYMINAIKKYGWDNVVHEIVAENLTVDQASQMEIDLIQKYNSADKSCGYNISPGGIKSKICSERTKDKLRQANLGKIMSKDSKRKISEFQKGQKRSVKTIAKMKESQKKNFENGNNAMHSLKAREKARQRLKGRTPARYVIERANKAKYRPVKNLQTGVVYQSIKEACYDCGVNRSTIIRHCNGTLKKQKWKYAERS